MCKIDFPVFPCEIVRVNYRCSVFFFLSISEPWKVLGPPPKVNPTNKSSDTNTTSPKTFRLETTVGGDFNFLQHFSPLLTVQVGKWWFWREATSSGWKFFPTNPTSSDGLGVSGGGSLGCLLRCGGALRGLRLGTFGVDGCGVDLWLWRLRRK